MKIYTKTGDDGTTGLVGGARTFKSSLRMEAIGDVDELNAVLGLVRLDDPESDLLRKIQNWLFEVGGELASPADHARAVRSIGAQQIQELEDSIDIIWAELPPLTNFILPGGCRLAAQIHLARTVCRRAERSVTRLHEEDNISQELRTFLNRLSDWLFAYARKANASAGVNDVPWERIEGIR